MSRSHTALLLLQRACLTPSRQQHGLHECVCPRSFYLSKNRSRQTIPFFGQSTTTTTSTGRWFSAVANVQSYNKREKTNRLHHHHKDNGIVRHRTTGIIAVPRSRSGRRSGSTTRLRYCFGCGAEIGGADHISRIGSSSSSGGGSGGRSSLVTTRLEQKNNYWHRQHRKLRQSQLQNWALCERCRLLREHDNVVEVLHNADNDYDDANDTEKLLQDLTPDRDMLRAFGEQVRQIRQTPQAVVIVCVDARNVCGTLLRNNLRRYVGGHAILLAVTRCDLLPAYVGPSSNSDSPPINTILGEEEDSYETLKKGKEIDNHHGKLEQLKKHIADLASDLHPANVYLCSCCAVDSAQPRQPSPQYTGLKDLATDLWKHLLGRDCYVVGSANIGKSTLVDTLVAGFLNRGEREGHFRDRRGRHRFHTLQKARVTTSPAVAGTTLQNVRIPCFANHRQALWDTPGLLLEERLRSIFPMRNLPQLQARRPRQIVPQEVHIGGCSKNVDLTKSFALTVTECNDPTWPLLRVEVRLKKMVDDTVDDSQQQQQQQLQQPVRCVWNSLLPGLEARLAPIQQCRADDPERVQCVRPERMKSQRTGTNQQQQTAVCEPPEGEEEQLHAPLDEEVDKEHMVRQAQERAMSTFERRREKMLEELVLVQEQVIVVSGGANGTPVGVDLAVAHVGWWTLQLPRTALVRTFAPHVGVRAKLQLPLGLPSRWGPYVPWRDPKELVDDGAVDSDNGKLDEELMLEEELQEYYYSSKFYANISSDDDVNEHDDEYIHSASNVDELRTSYEMARGSHHKLRDDPWVSYRGEAVGWHWDDRLPLTLQQWNPIRNNDKDNSKSNPTTIGATKHKENRHHPAQ